MPPKSASKVVKKESVPKQHSKQIKKEQKVELEPTMKPVKASNNKSSNNNTNTNINKALTKFSTTGTGLIQFNFADDSDGEDAPAPIPVDLQEDLHQLAANQNSQAFDKNDGQFFVQLGTSDGLPEVQLSKRSTIIQNTITSYTNLVRKRALAAASKLTPASEEQIQQSKNLQEKDVQAENDAFDDIKKRLMKQHRMKHFGVPDYASDDSDYAEDLLPVLDSDDEAKVDESARRLAKTKVEENKLALSTLKKGSATATGEEEEDPTTNMTPKQLEQYRRAAVALASSSEEEEYRYGASDDEMDEDDEKAEEELLNKDIFETQTAAFTTDETGLLTKVNHNISFADMYLSKPSIIALEKNGFTKPTPIQAASIPITLKGYDVMANAQTGSGKTVAFLLPILERLIRMPQRSRCIRAIVITPTRELAEQIFRVAIALTQYNSTDISASCIFGGVSIQSQEAELRQSPDIVICTPGRMIDHLTNTMGVSIDRCEVLVLDEADRLLDMGFRDEVQHIIDLSSKHRQTLLFSATVNSDVEDLIKKSLRGYKRVFVDKASSIVHTLTQQFIRLRHDNELLRQAIILSLCKREFKQKAIIFVKTKQHAQSLNVLFKLCGLNSGELHGDLNQTQRSEVMDMFRKQQLDFLIATDIAARGLDIKGVLTVINMHLPLNYNAYVHRVGRTARAGEKGTAISLVSETDRKLLREMMKVHDVDQDENPLNTKVKKEEDTKAKAKKDPKNNLLLNLKKREVSAETITKYTDKIQALQPHVEELLEEIKSAKQIDLAERDIVRAENLIVHKDNISERPKREWFQSNYDKTLAKEAAPLSSFTLKQQLKHAQEEKKMAQTLMDDFREMQQEDKDQDKKKKKRKDDVRGLSRVDRRRKLFRLDQEKHASELKHDLATNTNMSEKQRKQKEHQIVAILKPQITASFVKRSARRSNLDNKAEERDDHDGAGPQAFEEYAKQFDKVKHINNKRKRQQAVDALDSTSSTTKHRRFRETDDAHSNDATTLRRFFDSDKAYDKRQKSMETERKSNHKPKQTAGFKSSTRYNRRK